MGRLGFAFSTVGKIARGQDVSCPFCGSFETRLKQRKKLLWQLRQCDECRLMFRWPKDSMAENDSLYQRNDNESVVYAPSKDELTDLKEAQFRRANVDYSLRIATIQSLARSGKLLDYGASWGYGVAQFRAAGFDAFGLEISRPRADFGRTHLGMPIATAASAYSDGNFDVIHSAHALEHIPDLHGPFADFKRLLRPGGILVIFVPNAGSRDARALGVRWGGLINEKHVLALTAEFFDRNLSAFGFSLAYASSPYSNALRPLAEHPDLEGDELLVVGRKV